MTTPDHSRRSLLKYAVGLAAATPLAAGLARARPNGDDRLLYAFVGTFSSPLGDVPPTQVDLPPGNGRGVHVFMVDRTTGALTAAGVHELSTSPSDLAVNAAGTRLYSANETDRAGKDTEGTVSTFAIRPDGGLKLLNTVRSGEAGPTYVSLHPSGLCLLVANYFGGSVAVLPVGEDGTLDQPSDVKASDGKVGPTKARNAPKASFAISGHDRTHAQMTQADPAGKFVVQVDLGLDRIFVWKFQKGELATNDPAAVALPPAVLRPSTGFAEYPRAAIAAYRVSSPLLAGTRDIRVAPPRAAPPTTGPPPGGGPVPLAMRGARGCRSNCDFLP
jgi:hypothetical protein